MKYKLHYNQYGNLVYVSQDGVIEIEKKEDHVAGNSYAKYYNVSVGGSHVGSEPSLAKAKAKAEKLAASPEPGL